MAILKKRTRALLYAGKENKEARPTVRKTVAMSLKANRKIMDKGAGSIKKARKFKKSITRNHLTNSTFLSRFDKKATKI